MRLSRIPVTLLLALAVTVAGAALADQHDAGGPWPHFYVVKSKTDAAKIGEYRKAIGQIVEAHKRHDNGNLWAAFSPLTGGSDPVFYYFVPMNAMGEMDGWSTNMEIMNEALGAEAAGQALQTLSNVSKSKTMALSYSPQLSNPGAAIDRSPPNFVWTIHVKIEPGMMGGYMQAIAKLKEAHAGHENGYNWTAYMPAIGGQSNELYFFLEMDKMGDLDSWTPVPQVEAEAMGEEEAAAVRQKMAEMSTSKSMILALSPGFSNLPAPPAEE